jgi:hypothetical protein
VSKPVATPLASKPQGPTSTPTQIHAGKQSLVNKNLMSRDEAGAKEAVSSVPGSVHDSADDESEPSDASAAGPQGVPEEEGDDEGEEEPQNRALLRVMEVGGAESGDGLEDTGDDEVDGGEEQVDDV